MREILENGMCLNVLILIYLEGFGKQRTLQDVNSDVQALQVVRLVFYISRPHLLLHHLSTTRKTLKPLQGQLDGSYAQGCKGFFCKKSAFDSAKWL